MGAKNLDGGGNRFAALILSYAKSSTGFFFFRILPPNWGVCGALNIRIKKLLCFSHCVFLEPFLPTMGSLKRKEAPGGASATKSTKSSSGPRPPKRSKSDEPARAEKKTASGQGKSSASKEPEAPVASRLKEDEPLFPRGGGSILSPLEQKQIQIQAKKDVLFEQESRTASSEKTEGPPKKKKKPRKSSGKEGDAVEKAAKPEDAVKIESLNYKVRKERSICFAFILSILLTDLRAHLCLTI